MYTFYSLTVTISRPKRQLLQNCNGDWVRENGKYFHFSRLRLKVLMGSMTQLKDPFVELKVYENLFPVWEDIFNSFRKLYVLQIIINFTVSLWSSYLKLSM